MPVFGCADKIIIREIQLSGQITKILANLIGKFLWGHARHFSRFFNFLAMFVSSGQKGHIITIKPFKARHHIARQRCISMADMRFVIHIVNRCGDVIGLAHKFYPDRDAVEFKYPSNEVAQPLR